MTAIADRPEGEASWSPSRSFGALAAAAAVAAIALPLGRLVPLLGAPIMALALGMAIAPVAPMRPIRTELGLASRYVLQVGIVVLGATLGLQEVARVGASSLPVMLGTLVSALVAAALIGRSLGVPARLRALIGVGTAICGASAIAAVSGVVGARSSEIRYAISTIFVFNLAAVLLMPPLGHVLGLSQEAFGLWAGTAVNDASSTVAAGFAYGDDAAAHGLIVKLARTAMIVPVALALAIVVLRRQRGSEVGQASSGAVRRAIPWFLLWFLAASAANSLGLFGTAAEPALGYAGLVLTTVALAAVGLSSDLREMRTAGPRPLVLGALVWATVLSVSLATQALTGRLH